jgi:hypothetical protein
LQTGSQENGNRTTCRARTGLNCDFTSPNNSKKCEVVGNEGFTYNIFQAHTETCKEIILKYCVIYLYSVDL